MKNTLTINHATRTIIMDRTFAKFAANTFSEEYAHLQQVRRDYPNYQVALRHIRANDNKRTYKGLNYDYMEDYILTHGTEKKRTDNFNTYKEMRLIAECQSKAIRYPVIKRWFLAQYPEIANYGKKETLQVIVEGKPEQPNVSPIGSQGEAA